MEIDLVFLTPDFVEKYTKRSKEIVVDRYKMHDLTRKEILSVAAYFYDLYMNSRSGASTGGLQKDLKVKPPQFSEVN